MIDKEDFKIIEGNCLETLKTLPDESVQCCITSPPYYGLRDYGTSKWVGGDENCPHYRTSKQSDKTATGHKAMMEQGEAVGDAIYKTVCPLCGAIRVDEQIGLEETPEEYVNKLVEVFREVKRVLKDDGTLWLNLGDSYAGGAGRWGKENNMSEKESTNKGALLSTPKWEHKTIKPKDLIGIPWMVAKALQQPYYTGVVKNITDRVWLAAMMDGEGSFCLSQYNYKGKPKINLYISMTNASEKIINKFNELFPQEIKHIYAKSGVVRKQVYRVDIEQLEKKEQFICEIFPHMVEKRKQCIVAYTFLQLQKGMPNKKYGYTVEQSQKRSELVEIMHKLNAGEDVILPNYCVEPHSLYEDGFYLRQDIIWHKPNPMPESVKDRCTKSHEYIFLLSKSPKYYFDYEAIQEEATGYDGRKDTLLKGSPKYAGQAVVPNTGEQSMAKNGHERWKFKNLAYDGQQPNTMHELRANGEPDKVYTKTVPTKIAFGGNKYGDNNDSHFQTYSGNNWEQKVVVGEDGVEIPIRNKRDVWSVATKPYSGAHFATYPLDLIEPCVLAGSNVGDTILDPFNGSGTTGICALIHGRKYIGLEISQNYCNVARERINSAEFGELEDLVVTNIKEPKTIEEVEKIEDYKKYEKFGWDF